MIVVYGRASLVRVMSWEIEGVKSGFSNFRITGEKTLTQSLETFGSQDCTDCDPPAPPFAEAMAPTRTTVAPAPAITAAVFLNRHKLNIPNLRRDRFLRLCLRP